MSFLSKLFGISNRIEAAYMFLGTTSAVKAEECNAFFGFASRHLQEKNETFRKLYEQVQAEETRVYYNAGEADSFKGFLGAFLTWMRSEFNLYPGEYREIINKRLFIVEGLGQTLSSGESSPLAVTDGPTEVVQRGDKDSIGKEFQWAVVFYYHF